MNTQTLVQAAFAALGLGLVATAADAVEITIEPDDYVGPIGDVAPGAELSTFRSVGNGYTKTKVLSVVGGSWAPTGNRVFGHQTSLPGETYAHWDFLSKAHMCPLNPVLCGVPFYVLRVDFDLPTYEVSIYTTIRGEQAPDGIELQAFNDVGDRILRCKVPGVDQAVLQSGVLPPPRYMVNGSATGAICGEVIEKKNCTAWDPGDCDYVVRARVLRRQKDIHFAMAGGFLSQNSWANVDKLQYRLD